MKKNSKTNNAAANTAAARITVWATLGCAVILSTPPKSADRPYFGVRVQAESGERYSRTYRCPTLETASALAAKIAEDRGIPVKTVAAPERPVIHPPAAQ